jgi:hypothetical protein
MCAAWLRLCIGSGEGMAFCIEMLCLILCVCETLVHWS